MQVVRWWAVLLLVAVHCAVIQGDVAPRDGSNIEVWPCDDSVRQHWRVEGDAQKRLVLVDTDPLKCLTVNDQEWGMLNTSMWLQPCGGSRDAKQRFELTKAGEIIYAPLKKCATINWNEIGGDVELWECDGSPHQQWTFNKTDETVRSALNEMCLDAGALNHCDQPPLADMPFCDPEASPTDRARDLISRFTLEEKISQLMHMAPAIARFGVPMYNWWSESLHGVMSDCGERCPTSFPMPIGLGASFNMTLIHKMAQAISTEGRALHNEGIIGLDFWAPNINIFRDPRWGRGQETPGEDPLLNAQYVVNYMKGLQEGDDPRYIKVIGTCKHFAAYSLENWRGMDRFHFDAVVSDRDLVETYFPAFEACIRMGHARSLMCSYNSVNGVPACANKFLLEEVLRGNWEFDGYVVSDCDAIDVMQNDHNYTKTPEETCGAAMAAGTDLNCGTFYNNLDLAVAAGTVSLEQIDQALVRLFEHRMMLGMFDPEDAVSYNKLGVKDIDTPEHRALALDAAHQSIVLLKNSKGLLPLKPGQTVALIGPHANSTEMLLGNYHGTPPFVISPLEGVQSYASKVYYAHGCNISGHDTSGFAEAKAAAAKADTVVLMVGIDQTIEEETLDRDQIELPGMQLRLVQEVMAVGKPTVVVLVNGGPLAVEWIAEHADAIVAAFYGGEYAGQALADVLFGEYNPAGRLTTTWYPADYVDQMSMENMDMSAKPGHTYRYYTGKPVFEFGAGMSYTTFDIQWDKAPVQLGRTHDTVSYAATVTNTGNRAGDEVVLAFVTSNSTAGAADAAPLKQLFGFARVGLEPGESKQVFFDLTPGLRSQVDPLGRRWSVPGPHTVRIGALTTVTEFHGEPRELKSMFD